jgi:hypothetical protein
MDEAARNGHINVVQWLHSNRNEGCTVYAMNCISRAFKSPSNGFIQIETKAVTMAQWMELLLTVI